MKWLVPFWSHKSRRLARKNFAKYNPISPFLAYNPKEQTVHPERKNTLSETERLQLARQAFADYYARCFWYLRRDLEIGVGDIPEIARGLRLHGGRQGFILAARLCP